MSETRDYFDELIRTDREAFRAEATAALKNFTPDDRERAASLDAQHTSTDSVLRAWTEQIEPIHRDLEETRLSSSFKKYLIRHVGFHDDEADKVIDHMIAERKESLLDEVLDNLYAPAGHDELYQREYARELLRQSDADINDFMSRYIDFARAIEAAEKHHVTLCDPHTSWLERQKSALQVYKERQRISQDEEARLEEIDQQLDELVHSDTSLLGDIVEKEWEFITILDLRAKYQKQVDALPKSDYKNPSKRLKLFERVTGSFRDRETEKLAHASDTHSLKTLRSINESVYNLLLDIFDLHNAQRNRLLADIQRHTRLTQERDLIRLIQRNRQHFLHQKA